jgi:primosomal protein N' (replication factor Y) (superfamily II helicase)
MNTQATIEDQKPAARYAQVAVDQPLEGELTYRIPLELAEDVKVGSRVSVPLGRGNRVITGTVLEVLTGEPEWMGRGSQKAEEGSQEIEEGSQEPEAGSQKIEENASPEAAAFAGMLESAQTAFAPAKREKGTERATAIKEISEVLREVLPVPADLLQLARWISSYYCAPIGTTLAAMVPAAVKRAARLPQRVLIHLTDAARDRELFLAAVKLSPKSKTVYEKLLGLLTDGAVREQDVLTGAGISRPVLKRMLEKGVIRVEHQIEWPAMEGPDPEAFGPQVLERPETGAPRRAEAPGALALTADQQAALDAIEPLLNPSNFAVRVIHGVTGSGKTELYIRAIEKVVAAGKRAIVLVPEISLTPQTVKRFTRRFARVAVLHSGLRDTQRHQHWHAIASGWAQVIVGARSAVFAPAGDIGLIVVDEEHDASYKQDNAPRYHGRDVAIRRGQMLGIPVLLGSATPALESWHNANTNPHYKLLSLPTRPLGTQMPRVVIVDMKTQSRERRGLHILSTILEHHLKQTLERKKQAIFLLNRRGYAHYVMCPRCDWVLMCENCDATMVVHRTKPSPVADPDAPVPGAEGKQEFAKRYNQVQCHYCLTAQILPSLCPMCQAKLTHLGQGTQRAEDELTRKFPGIRIARMDSDSMRDAIDYQRTLQKFADGELDLLLGTQMISKGLDFPNVHLVGVLNADLAMTMPDFRAAERTFQLICQVAGRSGRAQERGSVVVQTFQPHEPAIEHACNHDYLGFVASELPHRQAFGYPPFGRMVRLLFSHKGFSKVQEESQKVIRLIEAIAARNSLPIRWQGPQPPPMERLVELYRNEIILFADSAVPLQRLLAALRYRHVFTQSAVTIAVDVDPVHMM